MASITQTIPSYTGGLSQQPDQLKVPGQVTKAQNVLPDVTEGLMKRPGSQLINSLMDNGTAALNSNHIGKWFHYYRDENEQYIGQIAQGGDINMWRCSDGAAQTIYVAAKPWLANTAYTVGQKVKNNSNVYKCSTAGGSEVSGGPTGSGTAIADNTVRWDFVAALSGLETSITNYLTHTSDEDLQTLTLNDFTYITNRTKTVAMTNTVEVERPPEAFIQLKRVAYANQYAVNLFDDTSLTEVTTATNLQFELLQSSNNYCDSNGAMVARSHRDSTTHRCDDSAGDGNDAFAPNVATRIFSMSDGASIKDYDAISGDHTYTLDVKNSSNASVNRGSNLYFRLTTTGQSVPYTTGTGTDQSTTYQARYTVTHDVLYGGEGWEEGDYFYFWMKDAYYKCTVKKISTSQIQANLGLIRPTPTSFDAKTVVTAESILGAIRTDIIAASSTWDSWTESVLDGIAGYGVKQIGNGLYIRRDTNSTFNISTPSTELLNVLTDSIADIADLPDQCRHGYVVKVANSDSDEDDYYVKFVGTNGRDGDGVWEECAKPGTQIEYDKTTLPVQLVRQADGSFVLDHIDWDNCPAGDSTVDGTNPRASFVGYTINKVLFFRNRFVMLSDENVIMSRPGDFTNFWGVSAIAASTRDHIDISCSSEFPAIVYDGIQVNAGLVLFTKNQQFMLTTDSDVLSPLTAKINFISSYNFNYKTNPFSLGTTLGFLDNAGKHSRFMEMARVLREGEPDVIEQSKIIGKSLDKNLDLVSNSRENGLAFFSEKNKTTLYGFRYFNSSDKRLQQAWFTWEFKNKIVHHAVLDDDLYLVTANSRTLTNENVTRNGNNLTLTNHGLAVGDTVVFHNGGGPALAYNGSTVADDTTFYVSTLPDSNNFTISTAANTTVGTLGGGHADNYINYTSNKNVLQKIPLKIHTDSMVVTDDRNTADTTDDITYKLHLDNMYAIASSSLSAYDAANDRTTFTVPTEFNLTSDLSAYVLAATTDDTLQGLTEDITVYKSGNDTKLSFPGNWKTYDITTAIVKTDAATRSGTEVTINYTDHPFKVGDALQLTFEVLDASTASNNITSGNYTVVTVNANGNSFTVTDSTSGTVAASDVTIRSTQTPNNTIIIGQKYDMEVKLPTLYYITQTDDTYRSDLRGSLVLHRIKLNFGNTGLYETIVNRTGKDDYTETWESTLADDYLGNQVSFEPEITRTIPIYEKNTNTSITIKSTHPSPVTLHSMVWEGDYTNRFYKRV